VLALGVGGAAGPKSVMIIQPHPTALRHLFVFGLSLGCRLATSETSRRL
jgi:hypothetical protein